MCHAGFNVSVLWFFFSHVAEDHLVFWEQRHIEQMNPFSQTFL